MFQRFNLFSVAGMVNRGALSLEQPSFLSKAQYGLSFLQLPTADDHPLFYVAIYGAITSFALLVNTISNLVQYTGGIRASRFLFQQILVSVVRSTMRWQDSTPTGSTHLLKNDSECDLSF